MTNKKWETNADQLCIAIDLLVSGPNITEKNRKKKANTTKNKPILWKKAHSCAYKENMSDIQHATPFPCIYFAHFN